MTEFLLLLAPCFNHTILLDFCGYQSPPSVQPDIDFDSMLQDLVATESLVSMKLMSKDSITIGCAHTGTVRDLVVSPASHVVDHCSAVPAHIQTIDTTKSVLFVDEASPTEFASRVAASSSHIHIPYHEVAAASFSMSDSPVFSPTQDSQTINNTRQTPLSLDSLTPTMVRAISFDEDDPPISISQFDMSASAEPIAMLRSNSIATSGKSNVSSFSSSYPNFGQSIGRKSSILKPRTSEVEPDILPLAPDLDAEDNYDSDDYRELYGEDYDRYNIYSSEDEYSSSEDGSESDEHVNTNTESDNSRTNSDIGFSAQNSASEKAGYDSEYKVSDAAQPKPPSRIKSKPKNKDEDIELPSDEDVLQKTLDDASYAQSSEVSQVSKSAFQNATVEDYEDMDGLLNVLNKIIRRNRSFKHSHPDDLSIQPIQRLTNRSLALSPTPVIPGFVLPEGSDDEDGHNTEASRHASASAESRLAQVVLNEYVAQYKDAQELRQDKISLIISKLNEANVKKITTRIYIEDARSFKTLVLTSLMSADQVVRNVIDSFHLDASPDWALFELCNDMGIERPVRDWEIVTDVISAWDTTNSLNAIVMKKYGYRVTLSCKSLTGRFPRIQGYLYLEMKPGKWHKRFCVLRDSIIYYFQEADSTETVLCNLSQFDVYTLSQHKKKTPTKFCFALRSTGSVSLYKNKHDYCKFISVEKRERLYDWVLALRLARNEHLFMDCPEMFEDYEGEIPSKALRRRTAAMQTSTNGTSTKSQSPNHSGLRTLSNAHGDFQRTPFSNGFAAQLPIIGNPQSDASPVRTNDSPLSTTSFSGSQFSSSDAARRAREAATTSSTGGNQTVYSSDSPQSQSFTSVNAEEAYRREKERRRMERREHEAREASRTGHLGLRTFSPPPSALVGSFNASQPTRDRAEGLYSEYTNRESDSPSRTSNTSRSRSSGSSRKGKIKPLVDLSGL
ncbi:hypothetical protein BDV3_001362 [Batrachochytrium dendrobatidis]